MRHFSDTIIIWYKENGRTLPWRELTDPYAIWISEIILQQTRVAQGYDYFVRFMRRFPDIATLASASEDEVMKHWQGLGYYTRARNLHAAAKSMNGRFPDTYEGVRALKGVGDYTAAAICSIAYGMPHAVVDGNVYRVLARYFGVETPIDSTEGRKFFFSLADEVLDRLRPSLHNQAMMDFGALVCTPRSPRCSQCPLSDGCAALAEGKVDRLPVKQHRTKTEERYFTYIYVKAGSHTYLNKRVAGIWRNLYEFPLIETDAHLDTAGLMAHPLYRSWLAPTAVSELRLIREGVKHVLSHRIIRADFYELIISEEEPFGTSFLKVRQDEVGDYAVPRLLQSFLEYRNPNEEEK